MSSHNRSFVSGFEKVEKDLEEDKRPSKKKHILRLAAGGLLGSMTGAGLSATHLKLRGASYSSPIGKLSDRVLIPAGFAAGLYAGHRHHKNKEEAAEDQKKTAAPAWYYEMNKTMNPLKNMKNQSTVGLKGIKAAKGLGK